MKEKQTGSFLTEALIISVSNLIVKIVGVAFRIPMTNMLQDNMEMFTAAYSVYAMLFMISNAGVPVAISRMVAASHARGRKTEVDRIFKAGIIVYGILGFICMSVMFFGADAIASYSEHADAAMAMRMISPSLFLVCILGAMRGYFQGHHIMQPTAYGQLIEVAFKFVIGVGAASYAVSHKLSPALQAAYAISGITIGMVLALIFTAVWKYFFEKKERTGEITESIGYGEIAKTIAKVAIPVTLTSSLLYLSSFIDTLVIKKGLMNSGIAETTAGSLYNAYSTLSLSISDLLPSTLVFPIAISILPAISASLAKNDEKKTNYYIHSSIRISAIIGFPCAFGLLAVARQALVLLYTAEWGSVIEWNGRICTSVDVATDGVRILALGIMFISVLTTTNSILPAVKKSFVPTFSVFCGVVVLVISEIVLVGTKSVGVYGAPIASVLCYIVALSLNLFSLKKFGYLNDSIISLFAKPLLCSALCGASAYAVVFLGNLVFTAETRFSSLVILCAAGIVGVVVYAVSMLAFKGITCDEVRILPKGNTLCAFLLRKGFIKEEN